MSLPVRLTPAAEQDILLAQQWYLVEAPHVRFAPPLDSPPP